MLGRRADGYHEIETLMLPVSLFDTLLFRPRESGGARLTVEGDAPADRSNTVLRAIQAFCESTGADEPNVEILLRKRIPSGAGLGGGSSDAAATLVAMQRLLGVRLPPRKMMETALKVGADCPFFLLRRPALMGGVGERPLASLTAERMEITVVVPPIKCSTARVYEKVDLTGRRRDAKLHLEGKSRITVGDLRRLAFNRLEAAARGLYVEMEEFAEALRDVGRFSMSGSGSAFWTVDAGIQPSIYAALGESARVYTLKPYEAGGTAADWGKGTCG